MSEMLPIQNPDDLAMCVQKLGRIAQEVVVVGSAAAYMGLDGDFRAPHDIDLAVSGNIYQELRSEHPEWNESLLPNGSPRLQGDHFDIGIGWGYENTLRLRESSWTSRGDLQVAALPDVYAWKDWRDRDVDREDLAVIRERLQGKDSTPLLADVMPQEIEYARNCLPEYLRDDPDAQPAIMFAANGLHIVRTVYGDITRGRVNRIVGDLEKIEYGALATYHEGGMHTPDGMCWLMRHFSAVNLADRAAGRPETFSKWDFFDGLITYSYHDAIFGNGREIYNAAGYDELRSSELVRAHAVSLNYIQDGTPSRLSEGVHGTTFHEASGKQRGAMDNDPFMRAVSGVDTQGLSEPNEVIRAYDLAAEYATSGRPDRDRVVGRALVAREVRVRNTRQLLEFADTYPNDRPISDSETVREAITHELERDASFIRDIYVYPKGWTGENQMMRQLHALELEKHIALIGRGGSMVECYESAHQHANAMRERFEAEGLSTDV